MVDSYDREIKGDRFENHLTERKVQLRHMEERNLFYDISFCLS
jgi:hypothetical protein